MIVAPNDDWLYVSVPKCGTSTMYALLGSFGGRRIGGGGGCQRRDRGVV